MTFATAEESLHSAGPNESQFDLHGRDDGMEDVLPAAELGREVIHEPAPESARHRDGILRLVVDALAVDSGQVTDAPAVCAQWQERRRLPVDEGCNIVCLVEDDLCKDISSNQTPGKGSR